MTAIYKREVSSYFKGILGYLFTAFVLIFTGIYTMAYNLSGAYANFEYTLSAIAFIYLIGVPILSMRSLAEERRQKTDQLLYAHIASDLCTEKPCEGLHICDIDGLGEIRAGHR